MFKQQVPTIGLSLEQGTGAVPDDGRFHILIEGEIVFSCKARSTALSRYRELRDGLLSESDVEQRVPDPAETRRREREFYDFQAVKYESQRERALNAKRKGGKGGSGGVG
jgi:hypothetical protein